MVFSITLLAVSLAAFLGAIMKIGKDVNGT
jgi:hypothetical protein